VIDGHRWAWLIRGDAQAKSMNALRSASDSKCSTKWMFLTSAKPSEVLGSENLDL
jgi:hypothetical protein